VYFYITEQEHIKMKTKHVALIAHDNKKLELVEWVEFNRERIARCHLYATGTTGRIIEDKTGQKVVRLQSGPLGGDQQIGALIAEGRIDLLIFFWDPLEPLPHDPDIKALLRLAVVWNIPVACNRATADFIFSSPLLFGDYQRRVPDFTAYTSRKL
jgi:methylglyoxal synthase